MKAGKANGLKYFSAALRNISDSTQRVAGQCLDEKISNCIARTAL
jgi:hypothetical protein